jgi:two-component system nitrate/nitrite response regulator NarL
VTVYVADDHPVYREGLSLFLHARREFQVVGEAEDGRQALLAIRALTPDVAVLDVQMPVVDGLSVLRTVLEDGLPTRIVLLSATIDPERESTAMAHGAAAYLSKEATRQDIADAVMAAAGAAPPSADDADAPFARRPGLSPRELEVLHLTAAGLSAPAIGRELHLSPETVKSHLKSVYDKLDVSDRAHAVAEAMRRGLLE